MKLRTLLLVGAAAFSWMLLTRAPADLVYAWFGPKATLVRPVGLEGSVADGGASALMQNGRPLLSRLHWRLQPWWLPLLRCAFHVDASSGGLDLAGRVAFSPGGISISGLHAEGPVKAALGAAGFGFAPVDGAARLQLASLKLKHGFPAAAEGSLEAHGLVWSLAKDPVPLGDFKATVTTEPEAILAHIEPLSGPLDLSGDVRLQPDRNYDYDLKLKARSGADPALQSLLQSLGQQDTQGYYHLRNRGSLGPAGPPPGAPMAVPRLAPPPPPPTGAAS